MTSDDGKLAKQTAGISYQLDVRHQGVDSGVIDRESGLPVYLFLEDGLVAGRAGSDPNAAISGEIAFTVAVGEGGRIHFEQHCIVVDRFTEDAIAGLYEPDLIKLTAIVTNPDGSEDHATAMIAGTLKITKGRPSLRSQTAVYSRAGVLGDAALSPRVGGQIRYELNVKWNGADSGATDIASGQKVFLFAEDGCIVGRIGEEPIAAASGCAAFILSVDASGNVIIDQLRAVRHADMQSDDPAPLLAPDLISLTATIADRQGLRDRASANIAGGLAFARAGAKTRMMRWLAQCRPKAAHGRWVEASAQYGSVPPFL